MFWQTSQLTRLMSGLRVTSIRLPLVSPLSSCLVKTVPMTPLWSPITMSTCQLRTGPSTSSMTQMETKLSPSQSIMRSESELRSETLDKINNKLETGPGRLFAVIFVRGIQHKVTQGEEQKTTLDENFRHMCLQSHLQTSPQTPQ